VFKEIVFGIRGRGKPGYASGNEHQAIAFDESFQTSPFSAKYVGF